MKNYIIVVLLVIISSRLCAQSDNSTLSFQEYIFDFGNILEENGMVSHTFIFKNRGKNPIVIDDVINGCGCTGSNFSKEPIGSGNKGQIILTYNPSYRPGFFSKETVVRSNNGKNINHLWIKGEVIPFDHPVEEDFPYNFGQGLHLSLKVLAFGKMKEGTSKQMKLRFVNDTDNPITLKFVIKDQIMGRNIEFIDPGTLLPKERGAMVLNYTMTQNKLDKQEFNLYPVVNGEKLKSPILVKVEGIAGAIRL